MLDESAGSTSTPRVKFARAIADWTSGKGITSNKHEPWHMPDKVVGMSSWSRTTKAMTVPGGWCQRVLPHVRQPRIDGGPARDEKPCGDARHGRRRSRAPEHTKLIVYVGTDVFEHVAVPDYPREGQSDGCRGRYVEERVRSRRHRLEVGGPPHFLGGVHQTTHIPWARTDTSGHTSRA